MSNSIFSMRLFCVFDKITKNNYPLYRSDFQLGSMSPSAFYQRQYSRSGKHILFLFSIHMNCITCIILSSLCVRVRLFFFHCIVLLLLRDLFLMSFRDHFSFTCSWTYVCTSVNWHKESMYTSYSRIFLRQNLVSTECYTICIY